MGESDRGAVRCFTMSIAAMSLVACGPDYLHLRDAKTVSVMLWAWQEQTGEELKSRILVDVNPVLNTPGPCVFGKDLRLSVNGLNVSTQMRPAIWDGDGEDCVAALLSAEIPLELLRTYSGTLDSDPGFEWDRVRIWDSSGELSFEVRELLGARRFRAPFPGVDSQLSMDSIVEFGMDTFGDDWQSEFISVRFPFRGSNELFKDVDGAMVQYGSRGITGLSFPAPRELPVGTRGRFWITMSGVRLVVRNCTVESCHADLDVWYEDRNFRETVP